MSRSMVQARRKHIFFGQAKSDRHDHAYTTCHAPFFAQINIIGPAKTGPTGPVAPALSGIPYFLEISPHLELSPPSKSRRVILTLNALNAALEFSPHVVKGRHYYCARIRTLY